MKKKKKIIYMSLTCSVQQVGFTLVMPLFKKGISKWLPTGYTCVFSLADLALNQLRKPEA